MTAISISGFEGIAEQLFSPLWSSGLSISPLQTSPKLARHSAGIEAELLDANGQELASGRLILLYDPPSRPDWLGDYRFVSYAQAEMDQAMVADPPLAEVGWSWLLDALNRHNCSFTNESGTVTRHSSQSFGRKCEDPQSSELEIRASWTPLPGPRLDFTGHLLAWRDLLSLVAGSIPVDDQVLPLERRLAVSWGK
jgi:hypothetical protein